jgi:hypothetical protein
LQKLCFSATPNVCKQSTHKQQKSATF